MKNNYFTSFVFGIMFLTNNLGPSQNILLDGDFSVTTENIYYDITKPPATSNSNNLFLKDLTTATQDKIVIVNTFQSAMNCAGDWDPNYDYTELNFHSATGLYTGTFPIPAGNNWYKVTVGGSLDINYGENDNINGADISLSVPSGSEETTFTYDPSINLVSTSPITSGFSPDYLPLVVLAGSFQDELGCVGDWVPDCTNTALTYNAGSGLFEGDFYIPAGCYEYRVVLENNWQNSFGQEGIHNGPNYIISIPSNPGITHFTYDPVSHIVISTPYNEPMEEVTQVSLIGTLQDELGCAYDYDYECGNPALLFNPGSGVWEANFSLPSGCYSYRVKETFGCTVTIYGENGVEWGNEIQVYVPSDGEITFSYDPQTHIVSSTPNNNSIEEVTKVSLFGSLQDELGCAYDYEFECDNPGLFFNPISSAWEGNFTLSAGCYIYHVKETSICNMVTFYGENGIEHGKEIQLYVPVDGEITFSYDPQTHILSSSPYSGAPQEATKVTLVGTLQDELGCAFDYDYVCDNPALLLNSDSGAWEGSFTLPAGCYAYRVRETSFCNVESFYGENGIEWGDEIQLYIPSAGEVTFSYDPQTNIITSTPYSGAQQELTKVSLVGTLQNEFGCSYDYQYECDNPVLEFNSESGAWEGSFTLPEGCYTYYVKETIGCNIASFYGENGIEWGNVIPLYVPSDGEITFSYDPQNHIMSSTPYSGAPQEVTTVSLIGTLQDELGCEYDYQYDCNNPALQFNPDSGAWEGSFTLPAGCYTYRVKEVFGCNNESFYGENGIEWGNEIELYVLSDGEIEFSYDPENHIISSTPNNVVPQEVTGVSLLGNIQDELGCEYDYQYECDNPALQFNPDSGVWEGSFTLPAGCYTYYVKETFGCNTVSLYGENGIGWGNQIYLFVPLEGEITFIYDPQTHIISSTPYGPPAQEVTKVSLMGTLQDELGCEYDYQYECSNPALQFNPDSRTWEGSFTLPAGCHSYYVKETFGCNIETLYGENGIAWGDRIELYVPADGEITFSYDPQTHILSSTPHSGVPQEVVKVSLIGTLQDELGCGYDYQYECDYPALQYNPGSDLWEGSFTLPAGCYNYYVKESFGCSFISFYGENGMEWGNEIQLYVPTNSVLTFKYDPITHIISSTPYSDSFTSYTCPTNISVDNSPGLCGAIVNYPEFVSTANCGGEILSVTQTEGLPGGSFFPVGITTNSFLLTRTTGEEFTCSFDVVVNDTESPVISGLNQSHETLWPPNHKMVPIFIEYTVSDNCNVASTKISIISNEPENGQGDGNHSPDWEILDEHNVLLRAERSGKGNGREYYITIKVTDDSGNIIEQIVTVTVPHDNGKKSKNTDYILYPNGADDVINLKELNSSSNPSFNSSYVIYDMLGIMKMRGTIINDQVEVKSLLPGVYILKFEIDKGYIHKKFIKN